MKNFEKFEDNIKRIGDNQIAIVKGIPRNCNETNCLHCDLLGKGCYKALIDWLYSEYKEPIVLTQFEHELLKRLKECGYQYLARDSYGDCLFAYTSKPSRKEIGWDAPNLFAIKGIFDDFGFIHWEDDEPYSIEELLKCEVKS